MVTQPKVLIEQLTAEFESNPDIAAFVLVGSQARETIYKATDYSDLEAYLIVKDGKVEAVERGLAEVVGKFGHVLFSFKHQIGFVGVYDDLFRVELPVVQKSEMASLFSRPKSQTVRILFDRTEGELEKVLVSRPEKIEYVSDFSNWITNFWYWQIIGVQYFKKGELYNTRAILHIHTSILIKLFELYNDPDILLLESNKRVEHFLTKEQLEKIRLVTPSYNERQIEDSLREVMTIYSEIAQAIKAKYGYSYNEKIEQEVQPRILEMLESN